MKLVVVKLGGNVLSQDSATHFIARDVCEMLESGVGIILVHGGGTLIDAELARLGITTQKKQGLRVTTDETLPVVQQVLDQVNGDLCTRLAQQGVKTQGFASASKLLQAEKAVVFTKSECPADLGHVGNVVSVDAAALGLATQHGYVPVVAPIGTDQNSQLLNINADQAAAAIAISVKASALIYLTDVPGVLTTSATGDGTGPALPIISENDYKALITNGAVAAGMLPKLDNAFPAAKSGVDCVQITDGRAPGALRQAVAQPGTNGTVISVSNHHKQLELQTQR